MVHARRPGARLIGMAGCLALALATPVSAASVIVGCAEDFDGNLEIGFADLTRLLNNWGSCDACLEDLDGSGAVGFADLTRFLGRWGPCVQEYPPLRANAEAEQIGLELLGANGPLFVSDEVYERVDRDLDLLRAAEPFLADQFHSKHWCGERLILSLDQDVPHDRFEALNAFFQAEIYAELEILNFTIIQFPRTVNANAMRQVYLAAPEVMTASPDAVIGGANDYAPTVLGGTGDVWLWNIDDGFQDCTDGCDCHYYYTFTTTGGGDVNLVSSSSSGASWCAFPF